MDWFSLRILKCGLAFILFFGDLDVSTSAAVRVQNENLRENEKKWTKPLMEAGWTVLPSVILDRQQAFDLDPVDINILMHLAKHWWYQDNLPHPSKKAIADCMGVSPSTVQRHIARMERDGLIQRRKRFDKTYGQQTNLYDFAGLIKEAAPYAQEELERREKRKEEKAATRKRKGLRLVNGN